MWQRAREYESKMCSQIYGIKVTFLVTVSIRQLITTGVVSVEESRSLLDLSWTNVTYENPRDTVAAPMVENFRQLLCIRLQAFTTEKDRGSSDCCGSFVCLFVNSIVEIPDCPSEGPGSCAQYCRSQGVGSRVSSQHPRYSRRGHGC